VHALDHVLVLDLDTTARLGEDRGEVVAILGGRVVAKLVRPGHETLDVLAARAVNDVELRGAAALDGALDATIGIIFAADVDDRAVRERELRDVQVGVVELVPTGARGGAFTRELAHDVACVGRVICNQWTRVPC